MNIRIVRYLATAVVVLTAFTALSAKSLRTWDVEATTRKADFIYLEALRQNMLSNDDAAYELVSRSYDMHPTDPYVGWEKGVTLLRLSQGDSAMVVDGVNMMGRYVKSHPSDLYSSLMLASILDRIGQYDAAAKIWETLHGVYPTRAEVTYRYADMLAQSPDQDRRQRAIELYDSLEISEGKSVTLTGQKMRLLLRDQDTTAILGELHALLSALPNSVEANTFAGNVMAQFATRDSALKYYDKALEIDPTSGFAYYCRANYFRSINDSTAYDREVFEALKQPDLDLAVKLGIFQEYIKELYSDPQQQPRIADLFKVLIDLHPHEGEIHKLYTDYLVAVKDYAGAAEQADYALSLDPSEEMAWVQLMGMYMMANEPVKALDASARGKHYFPENASFPTFEAMCYVTLKKYDEAQAAVDTALTLVDASDYVKIAELYTTKGDIFYSQKQPDSAFVYYDKAIAIDPEATTAMNNAAYYLANSDKDLDRALELVERCMALRPNDPTTMDTYAWVLFKLKRYDEALKAIDQVLEEGNEDILSSEVYDHAGDIYFMNQQPKEALEYWKKALELDGDNELLKRKVQHKTYFYE